MLLLVGCSSTPQKEDGIDALTQQRIEQWKNLIDSGSQWSDLKKLTSVNDFVNQFNFVDDIDHWRKQDYWATPLETLVTKGGDCEDFAIAKYFTLTAMGMPKEKMRLTYVKALSINKAHMVVSYYEQRNAEPLLLDNLNRKILPASQRQDLVPAYSFNGTGLWLSKKAKTDEYVDDSSRISLWQQLIYRMDVEAADEKAMICLYQYYDLPVSVAKTKCS
ncbi:MAG: transglutaminase-like cysteine peptidase [Gammaproteobacteria bacterium]|nr:transglutaminase-like cysteine peptidase [Gammaproteobacteria bacterium]